jgi:hypothetical protein
MKKIKERILKKRNKVNRITLINLKIIISNKRLNNKDSKWEDHMELAIYHPISIQLIIQCLELTTLIYKSIQFRSFALTRTNLMIYHLNSKVRLTHLK